MPPKIRLLIVDDSIYMQMALKAIVRLDPGIEIVGSANTGEQAVAMALELRPDIITMDVNMPGLDGVEATRRIMTASPTAILMLSSHTERGLATTRKALEAGAVDYIPKSSSAINVDLATIAAQVAAKIRFWGTSAVTTGSASSSAASPAVADVRPDLVIFAGGSGSPLVIGQLLRAMPELPCPVIVTLDDMAADTTLAFVDYLSRTTTHAIREGGHHAALQPDAVTIMPGGRNGTLIKDDVGNLALDLRANVQSPANGTLLTTALTQATAPLLVVLSGKARDLGALPAVIANKPTTILVQAPETCAVDELPKAVGHLGLPCAELDLSSLSLVLGQLRQAA